MYGWQNLGLLLFWLVFAKCRPFASFWALINRQQGGSREAKWDLTLQIECQRYNRECQQTLKP